MLTGITAFGNEAAAGELNGQAKIVGELLGGVHQFSLDLDTAGVKVQHGGQTGHHSKAAAPFAELVASEQICRRECLQGVIRSLVVARNKGGNPMGALEATDALGCLAQQSADISGQNGSCAPYLKVAKRHRRPRILGSANPR